MYVIIMYGGLGQPFGEILTFWFSEKNISLFFYVASKGLGLGLGLTLTHTVGFSQTITHTIGAYI